MLNSAEVRIAEALLGGGVPMVKELSESLSEEIEDMVLY